MDNVQIRKHTEELLVTEVQSMPDERINWGALARKYDVKLANSNKELKNGGQVVKEYLRTKGVNVDRLSRDNAIPRIRRKRKRGLGGEVSMPINPSIKDVNDTITRKIENGEYELGELIAPKEYTNVKLTSDGKFSTEILVTHGRKIPMKKIRQQLLNEHERLGLLRARDNYNSIPIEDIISRLQYLGECSEGASEEDQRQKLKKLETTRYQCCWADHSTIGGHTYALYTFSCLYDEALFLTDEELRERRIKNFDVEEVIGKPQIHIVARCGSSDETTLAYADERRKGVASLIEPVITSSGLEYNDILRFFTGDMPALAAESGQQYGGHYPCGNCGSQALMFDDCAHILRRPLRSMNDRLAILHSGGSGSNSKCRLFSTLSKQELISELTQQKLDTAGNKKELSDRLHKEVGGIQRVPTLLLNTNHTSFDALDLSQYELTLTEPLHDYSNHIKNLLNEIPAHLTKEAKKQLEDVLQAIFKEKQTIRGCDYRDAAVLLPQMVCGEGIELIDGMQELLNTLGDIGRILYSTDAKRTNQSILRLHLVTWKHWMLLREVFPTPKKLTTKALGILFARTTSSFSYFVQGDLPPIAKYRERRKNVWNAKGHYKAYLKHASRRN